MNEHPSPSDPNGSTSKRFLVWIAYLPLLLLLYVLSPVPVGVAMHNLGLHSFDGLVETFFFPLQWMFDNYAIVEQFYSWQFSLVERLGLMPD